MSSTEVKMIALRYVAAAAAALENLRKSAAAVAQRTAATATTTAVTTAFDSRSESAGDILSPYLEGTMGYDYTPCARDHWHFSPRGSFDAARGDFFGRSLWSTRLKGQFFVGPSRNLVY